MAKKKILVIGQTPPPYGGQAMMTQRLIEADLPGVETFLVRMSFSKSMKQVGKFGFWKVYHMIQIVIQACLHKLKYNIHALYYMPVGTNKVPLIRDIFILSLIRVFYPKTIFHFRAAGVGDFVESRSWLLKKLAKWAYNRPQLAIHLAACNPDDGGYFRASKTVVIPNGLEDAAVPYLPITRDSKGPVKILFVGVVRESKGAKVLLESTQILHQKGYEIEIILMGGQHDSSFMKQLHEFCREHRLENVVNFIGVKTGAEKWDYFREADILCFPSFFESESFGNVLVEAMMFELPVVATQWRGIPSLVIDGENGFLIPIKAAALTAEALEKLIANPALRKKMGKTGRAIFEQKYRLNTFIDNINEALASV